MSFDSEEFEDATDDTAGFAGADCVVDVDDDVAVLFVGVATLFGAAVAFFGAAATLFDSEFPAFALAAAAVAVARIFWATDDFGGTLPDGVFFGTADDGVTVGVCGVDFCEGFFEVIGFAALTLVTGVETDGVLTVDLA